VSVVALPARWLIVVQRDQPDLFRHLAARFDDVAFIEVILDRRQSERRGTAAPVAADRRRAERRQTPPPDEREHWAVFGYRLVRHEVAS
jgi:hypothetical protein